MSSRQWALITGVSEGGLGDALVSAFLARNVCVIASSLDFDLLAYLPDISQLQKVQLDVTSPESITQALSKVTEITNGKLDFLINNAGYGYMMPLLDASIKDFKRQYEVNVFGLLAVTQAFFPLLKASNGMVVNQCSIAGLPAGTQPNIGPYSSSKAAVISLSNTMRLEFLPFNVKVVTLITGDVKTEFWKNASRVSGRLPQDSLYAPIRDHIEAMMSGKTNPPGGHERGAWARNVVSDLLVRHPSRYVRRGFLAIIIWLVSALLPTWLVDWNFWKAAKLDVLEKSMSSK